MTYKFVLLLTHKKRFYLRILVWSAAVSVLILSLNSSIWHKLSANTILALLCPYVLTLCVWLMIADLYRRSRSLRWAIWLLVVFFFCFSQYSAYLYFYRILPELDVQFFSKPINGYEGRFISRSATANVLFATIATLDFLFWDKVILNYKVERMQRRMDDLKTSYQLSSHFISNLLAIVRSQKLERQHEIFAFFDYIFLNLERRRNMVSLKEEWKNVELLMAICKHRAYAITGLESLMDTDWNQSVPALSLLTWMENAIQYSPEQGLIYLHWQLDSGVLSLQITNSIAHAADGMKLSGTGLQLVETLLNYPQFAVRYSLTDKNLFNLLFIIK